MTEMVHDKLFKEYNVDIKELEHEKPLKFITPEMLLEIIKTCIRDIGGYDNYEENPKLKYIKLYFKTNNDAKEFEKKFNITIFSAINKYLISVNLDPNDYKRTISVSVDGDLNIKTINY